MKTGELYNPFRLNPDIFNGIKAIRGWKSHGSQQKFADETGATRSYVCRLLKGDSAISASMMYETAKAAGMVKIDDQGRIIIPDLGRIIYVEPLSVHNNHQVFNYPKMRGERPYRKYSISAAFRRDEENEVEEERFFRKSVDNGNG